MAHSHLSLSLSPTHTHTYTHTYIYIYLHIHIHTRSLSACIDPDDECILDTNEAIDDGTAIGASEVYLELLQKKDYKEAGDDYEGATSLFSSDYHSYGNTDLVGNIYWCTVV